MQGLKEGFFVQIDRDQYLLGTGPLSLSTQPDRNKWSLFHPPFFYSVNPTCRGRGLFCPDLLQPSIVNPTWRGRDVDGGFTLPIGDLCQAPSNKARNTAHGAYQPSAKEVVALIKRNTAHGAYWYIPSSTVLLSQKEILSLFKGKKEFKPQCITWRPPSFSLFQSQFSQILQEINQTGFEKDVPLEVFSSGNQAQKHENSHQNSINPSWLKKVVPVFFETAPFELTEQNTKALLYRLLATHSDQGMAYALWFGDRAIMGRTPEYLFQKEYLNIRTMALAGTARSAQHNLLRDPKERQEQEWVFKGIQSILNQNGISPLGEYSSSGPYVYPVGNIQHLRTDFKLKLKKDISFQKLCALLHPTPALGGFPKKQALELLLKWECQGLDSRYGFGAPFGVAGQNRGVCLVAIRNVQFIKGKAYIGSGCGLVQGSHITTEWQELKKKRDFIKNILFKK